MKYLLLALVVGVALFLLFGRSRKSLRGEAPQSDAAPAARGDGPAEPMLACAHCGVHLPRADAVLDADRRPFCSDAHRLAGPR